MVGLYSGGSNSEGEVIGGRDLITDTVGEGGSVWDDFSDVLELSEEDSEEEDDEVLNKVILASIVSTF